MWHQGVYSLVTYIFWHLLRELSYQLYERTTPIYQWVDLSILWCKCSIIHRATTCAVERVWVILRCFITVPSKVLNAIYIVQCQSELQMGRRHSEHLWNLLTVVKLTSLHFLTCSWRSEISCLKSCVWKIVSTIPPIDKHHATQTAAISIPYTQRVL